MGNFDRIGDDWNGVGAQFEWDEVKRRWLFRRKGRGTPVEVTREEMIRAQEMEQNGMFGLAGGLTLVVVLVFAFGPSNFPNHELASLITILAVVLLGVAGIHLLNRLVTWPFEDRQPLGPPRTRMEARRRWVQRASWTELSWQLLIAAMLVWQSWPMIELSDWFGMAIAAGIAALVFFHLGLKFQASRS